MNNTSRNGMPVGPVIGLVLIIAIIVLGGVYFWTSRDTVNNGMYDSNQIQDRNDMSGNSTSTSSGTYNSAEIELLLNSTNPENINTSEL